MKKGLKICIIVIILIVFISAGLFVVFFLLPSKKPKGPEANTYAENTTINFIEYAIKFSNGDIVLENSFNISNGKLNGYDIINSTILTNCTINNETRLSSISLHKNVKLTMKNINNSDLTIFLHDDSSLMLQNCTFYEIWVLDYSSVIIKNSTIGYINVYPPIEEIRVYNYQTSVSIENNSTIRSIYISEGCDLSIKDSRLIGYSSLTIQTFSPLTSIIANIENCTLRRVSVEGYANLKFYGSTLFGLDLYDMARATLIQSTITAYFQYGIVAYSGTTNIIEGMVTGSGYLNNTKLINSNVTTPLLVSVAANNSAIVEMNNFSCSVYLYDTSSAIIANVTDPWTFSMFHGTLMNSSSLILENTDIWGDLYCRDNSALVMRNSSLDSLHCDTSNSITIDKSYLYDLSTYSFLTNLAVDNIYITNSTLHRLIVGGRDVLYVENCTLSNLYEGVIVYSGSVTLDLGGFSGTGDYKNSTTLIDTDIIFSRRLRYIEINGSAQLKVQDNFDDLDFLCQDNAMLTCKNSSIDNIICQDFTTLMIENCTIHEQILLMDDSVVNVTKNTHIGRLEAGGNSIASITDTTLWLILIYETSRVMVENSSMFYIVVYGSNTIDYAVKVYDSKVEHLLTFTWS